MAEESTNQGIAPAQAAQRSSDQGLPMPEDVKGGGGGAGARLDQEQGGQAPDKTISSPPGFGKQMAQLVVIPALIVVAVLIMMLIFGILGGQKESLESMVYRLKQGGGMGRMAGGFQDPAYKDRWRAAANIAELLRPRADASGDPDKRTWPEPLDDPQKRAWLSTELVAVIEAADPSQKGDELMQVYLLSAIGTLGEKGALITIRDQMKSPSSKVKQAAVRAAMVWPRPAEARQLIPSIITVMQQGEAEPRAFAALALGYLARAEDSDAIAALRGALSQAGSEFIDVYINAAISLARLGDEQGERIVASQLLVRDEMKKLVQRGARSQATEREMGSTLDKAMVTVLVHAQHMKSEAVWDRIAMLAEVDPSREVRGAARSLQVERTRD